MADISTFFNSMINNDNITRSKQANPAASSSFDALFADASLRANSKDLAGDFIQNIMRSLENTLNNARKQNSSSENMFSFSTEFEGVFGSSGPLLDFINLTTSRLKLNAQQNMALQNIAIHNKDVTSTPANIQKIAQELRQAGIT